MLSFRGGGKLIRQSCIGRAINQYDSLLFIIFIQCSKIDSNTTNIVTQRVEVKPANCDRLGITFEIGQLSGDVTIHHSTCPEEGCGFARYSSFKKELTIYLNLSSCKNYTGIEIRYHLLNSEVNKKITNWEAKPFGNCCLFLSIE